METTKSIVVGGHTRIRPFNTSVTYPEQNLDNDPPGRRRGQHGLRARADRPGPRHQQSVGIGDVEAQTERAMANIQMLLEEAGARMEHLVKLTIYIVDPRYRGDRLPHHRPLDEGRAPDLHGHRRLRPRPPRWLVEVDAIAVIP